MKRLLCMLLVLVMALSLAVPAFADGHSTIVEYDTSTNSGTDTDGDGDTDGDDPSGPIQERFTLEVPASMKPGESKNDVKLYGYWASNRKVSVVADTTVQLSSAGITEKYNLNVTLDNANAVADRGGQISANVVSALPGANGFQVVGVNSDNCFVTAKVSVSNFNGNAPLLGVWSGTFNYTLAIANV